MWRMLADSLVTWREIADHWHSALRTRSDPASRCTTNAQ